MLCLVGAIYSATCPDVSKFRTSNVLDSYDPKKMTGIWYEQAYQDLAQAGARCPVLNTTYDGNSGVMLTAFEVDYGKIPFTIIEQYAPVNNTVNNNGLYHKTAKMPGGKFLEFATSVVDVVLSPDNSTYDAYIMYSCLNKIVEVQELQIITRSKNVSDAVINLYISNAQKQGLDLKLKRVDWSKC